MVSAPDRRKLARYLISQEVSERRSLAIAGISGSVDIGLSVSNWDASRFPMRQRLVSSVTCLRISA